MSDLEHDPIRDHADCEICNAALRRVLDREADLAFLRSEDVDVFVDRVVSSARRILEEPA